MYTERILMPTLLQKYMLKEFDVELSGNSRVKSLMKCYMYWPKIDHDLENLVK